MKRLWAISDLHLGYKANREALQALGDYGDDGLIVAGDVGETIQHLELAWSHLRDRFGTLFWVPGNHELWSAGEQDPKLRGQQKYLQLVDSCRRFGVHTPEDPWVTWPTPDGERRIVLLHLLYDYSFRPDDVPAEGAVDWARESGVVCADEIRLHPDPYPSRQAWCQELCRAAERRLSELERGERTVLVNHYPLRADLAVLPRIPRFSIWCGTKQTESWHRDYGADVVVSGHIHIRSTQWRDEVRFEEVSLGYPKQWDPRRDLDHYLRLILPGPGDENVGGERWIL